MSLADGTYEVIVVDAADRGGGDVAIEVAVSSGPMRGHVVTLVASHFDKSEFELLAAPATLVVTDGQPRLTLD
jgi:hypothetical protein